MQTKRSAVHVSALGRQFGDNGIKNGIILVLLSAIAIIQLYPLVWLLLFSLKSNDEIFSGNAVGIPKTFVWSNFKVSLIDANVGVYFINSVFVTIITILAVTILGLMASYAIERMRWKFRNAVFYVFLIGMMIPTISALLPLMIVLKELKMYNNYFSLIFPYVSYNLPIAILIFGSYMNTIPREVEEAAIIDGCGVFRCFIMIITPLAKPVIATVAIFTFLQSWNELMFALTFINDPKYKTLTVGINALLGQYITDWGVVGSALVIATIPIVIIYTIMSKQIQQSLISGSLKG